MKEEIIETITNLHDGYIESILKNESELKINISTHLSINNETEIYEILTIVLDGISDLEFLDWSECKTIFSSLESVISFATGIIITTCNIEVDGRISINGHGGNSSDETSCGGSIVFNCLKYRILDINGNELSLEKLNQLNENYWRNNNQENK